MTMHLVRGMSSLRTNKHKQQGLTQRDRDAKVEHDKWLRERGLHPERERERERERHGKLSDTLMPDKFIFYSDNESE